MPEITVLGKWRQENEEFKVFLCYLEHLCQPGLRKTVSQKKKKKSKHLGGRSLYSRLAWST